MCDIELWVGLPGSGKTYHAKKLCDIVVDDIAELSQLPSPEEIKGKRLGITDVNFCDRRILHKAITELFRIYPGAIIGIHYFENDAEKCRANVAHRNDGRNVEGTIRRFEKIYDPCRITAQEIWQKEK